MEEATKRTARTRRRIYKNLKENIENEIRKTIENLESPMEPQTTQSSEKFVHEFEGRKSKRDSDTMSGEDLNLSSFVSSRNESPTSENLTYSVNKKSEVDTQDTYTVKMPEVSEQEIRPVPAPRKRKSVIVEQEKVSSDTDKDVVEIEVDEITVKPDTLPSDASQDQTSAVVCPVAVPVPKPRGISPSLRLEINRKPNFQKQKSKSMENLSTTTNTVIERTVKSETEYDINIPVIEFSVPSEPKKEQPKQEKKAKPQKKVNLAKILEKKKKKAKEKLKLGKKAEAEVIPSISSTIKGSERTDSKEKSDDDKSDFFIDSPQYPVPVQNGKIYVQSNNGFYIVDREEILNNDNLGTENFDYGREMEDSTLKTAILFQKYWSRSMTYFHGVLAGFAFSHAATVTAIMLHYNYEPQDFIGIYSCLSLKIHFIFYTLTTLCLISCFDRIDVGHMNLKHWRVAWKSPSMWIVLFLYFISFVLTFSNQKTEARFDSYLHGNETEAMIWQTQEKSNIQISLLTWYHTVWARDMLVLLAWLFISLTEFPDHMFNHLNNMAKYIKIKDNLNVHKISRQVTNNL